MPTSKVMTKKENILKTFDFMLYSLKDKVHTFDYTIEDSFFQNFENSPVEKGNFDIHVVLDKSERLLQFHFEIVGKANLICDRSLDSFDYEIDKKASIVFKYGEKYEEAAEDLIILEHGTSIINIAKFIYELIAITIPFKKLHPRFNDEEDSEDEIELVYKDEQLEEAKEQENIDPRWEDLKKKFDNNL